MCMCRRKKKEIGGKGNTGMGTTNSFEKLGWEVECR